MGPDRFVYFFFVRVHKHGGGGRRYQQRDLSKAERKDIRDFYASASAGSQTKMLVVRH